MPEDAPELEPELPPEPPAGTAPEMPLAETPLPGKKLPDLQDPAIVIDLFERAALANITCPLRRGSTVHLPPRGKLLMTGDLHDNGMNLQRILRLAALPYNPDHHLILHEVIHGREHVNNRDLSVRSLARVAALKLEHPGQIHLMLGNHELSQLCGDEILKNGRSVVQAFNDGMDCVYGDDTPRVKEAMDKFIRSLLLAVKLPNGIFCSHSLPSPRRLGAFDPTVIDRVPTDADLASTGSAHDMVWGRNHTRELAEDLGDDWGVQLFVMGHQPADFGYEVIEDLMLVLASDHQHGQALPIQLTRKYDMNKLTDALVPLASVTV